MHHGLMPPGGELLPMEYGDGPWNSLVFHVPRLLKQLARSEGRKTFSRFICSSHRKRIQFLFSWSLLSSARHCLLIKKSHKLIANDKLTAAGQPDCVRERHFRVAGAGAVLPGSSLVPAGELLNTQENPTPFRPDPLGVGFGHRIF